MLTTVWYMAATVLVVNFSGTKFWNELVTGGHELFAVMCVFVGLAALVTRRLTVLVMGILALGIAAIPVFNPGFVQDVGNTISTLFQG